MMRKIINAKSGFLIFIGFLLSCNRDSCKQENFYSIYQTRFEVSKLNDEFVKNDLEIKRKIFSTLCISNRLQKMLIIEWKSGTQSFYSRGLLFTYDDSKTYYFKMRDGEVIAGKGSDGNVDLDKILIQVKNDFSGEKIKMGKNHNDIFDAPIVNVLLYDSLMPGKFDSFNSPIVLWDSLLSQ
jgi:hypothetical protein